MARPTDDFFELFRKKRVFSIKKVVGPKRLRSDKHIWNIIFIFVGKSYTQNVSLFVTMRSFTTHLQIAQTVKRLSIILWEGSWRMALEIYFGGILKVLPKESNGTVNTTYEKWIEEFFWPFGLGNLGKIECAMKFDPHKQVGFANCSCGCENNLLKLCDQIDFDLGGPEDPIYEDLTDEQIQTMVMAMKYEKNSNEWRIEENNDAVILNSIRGACSNSFFKKSVKLQRCNFTQKKFIRKSPGVR